LVHRLIEARSALSDDQIGKLVLEIVRDDLDDVLSRYVTAHKRELVVTIENWWNKYSTSLKIIEVGRDVIADRLTNLIEELGYAKL